MFGRKLAVTTVKASTRNAEPETSPDVAPMEFEKLAELAQTTIVTTAVGVGIVVVSVKVLSTLCNIIEDLTKKHL